MKLSIVIPALNEEQSIKSIIKRCMDAKEHILSTTGIEEVNITVVSDGSSDNTVVYAREFINDINLIVFEHNRGYGAAIKEGWSKSNDDLLGFLDADGTCDPYFFADLVKLILEDNADIAIGNRINKNSKMPKIRRFGNKLYSILLSFLSSKSVKDTASGMRVIRKTILDDIYPLPDGLHFTPAMSAKALTNPEIKILEKDMSYEEREGESKLHVVKDGILFLSIILKLAFMYRPSIFTNTAAVFIALLSVILIFEPSIYYIQNGNLEEYMFYRISFSGLGSILVTLFFGISYLAEKIVRVSILKNHNQKGDKSIIGKFFNSNIPFVMITALLVFGVLLIQNSFVSRLIYGQTYEHWSRYLAMVFLVANAFVLISVKILDYSLKLIIAKKDYLQLKN